MYTVAFIFILIPILIISYRIVNARKGISKMPTNWPVVGMVPGMILNSARVLDYVTEIVAESGGTFQFKGPIFSNMEMIWTCDPANVNYILTKNFSNFGKGPNFKEIFDILGDGIFNAEAGSWENQRKICKSVLGNAGFQDHVSMTTWRKMETGLIPILEHASEIGMEMDLQELFQRFAFDCSCILNLGHDPASLCKEFPNLPYEKGFTDVEEALLYRHIIPQALWKMQKWLEIGREKKLTQAKKTICGFLSYCISLKEENSKPANLLTTHGTAEDADILTSCMKALTEQGDKTKTSEKFLDDLMLNLLSAGKDTISAALTWFFWLLATHPSEEEMIRNEIEANSEEPRQWKFSNMDGLNKLIYLQGALCETMRLFPPVPFQHKAPLHDDILPSGHQIKAQTATILGFYSMGRMESIWGKDCLQFKPGRWISGDRVRSEPAYKFTAFNAGPRSCLGKDMSFIQLKITAAAIVSRFGIEVVEGHPIQPSTSIVLQMKHGLKVNVSKYV